MLDLKAKLAAAGLVTKEDVERAEKAKAKRGKGRRSGRARGAKADGPPRLRVAELRKDGKGQQYEAVRRYVEKVRLDDPGRLPGEAAATFHFPTLEGQIGRLVLEPAIHGRVSDGGAGIVAYMSNHGLAHAVVPAAAARDVGELFPLWLRVLKGHPTAGAIESESEGEGG